MTYRELKAHIEVMDKEQLEMDVTVFDDASDEYLPIYDIDFTVENDILVDNHPVLIF